jgi:hypothetical protein
MRATSSADLIVVGSGGAALTAAQHPAGVADTVELGREYLRAVVGDDRPRSCRGCCYWMPTSIRS